MRGDPLTTETSIYEYAKQGLAHGAERTAIWFYGRSLSYGELFEKIDNAADHLYALGVRQGSVVTIHLPNCPQAVMAIYAVAKLGGICNMVNSKASEEDLKAILQKTGSKYCVTYRQPHQIPFTIFVDVASCMEAPYRDVYRSKFDGSSPGQSFAELEAPGMKGVFPKAETLAGTCALYLHSSGTTGEPKTVMLSHSALNHCVENTAEYFEYNDVSLSALPLFHVFGLTMDAHRSVSLGGTMVQLATWDSDLAVSFIKSRRVTAMLGVPSMYHSLLSNPAFRGPEVSQMARCYVGGDTVDTRLVRDFDARIGHGHCLFPGYGLTEATINCVNRPAHYKEGSIGYPMVNTELGVLDHFAHVSRQGTGELVISSRTVMLGYLRDEDATGETMFESEGRTWTRTGDQVLIDEDGFVFFQERLKTIIVHNGNNIYPREIEEVLHAIPCVADVCVVGAFDETIQTERILAAVVLKEGQAAEAANTLLHEICGQKLPKHMRPSEFRFFQSLPVTSVGKTDRNAVKKLL